MRVAMTTDALFLDIDNLTGAANVPVTPHDAPARQRGKAEESNNAHDDLQGRS